MYKVLILTIVMLFLLMVGVVVRYACSAPYLYKADPAIFLVMEMKPGCRSGHMPLACIGGAMKSLNKGGEMKKATYDFCMETLIIGMRKGHMFDIRDIYLNYR
jgi:hypothetical protein